MVAALRQSETQTSTFSGVRAIVVEDDIGHVTLTRATGTDVDLRSQLRWAVQAPKPTAVVAGGTLTVRGTCPTLAAGCGVDEQLSVPAGVPVRVTASLGGITATDLDVPSLDATASAGGVTASFVRTPDHVSVSSSAGDVQLTLPQSVYRVSAATATGQVVVDVPTDPHAERTVDAHASAGDVRIALR